MTRLCRLLWARCLGVLFLSRSIYGEAVTSSERCRGNDYWTSDVVIVGGGLAGLSAALRLAKRSSRCITILEADENHLGGKVRSWNMGVVPNVSSEDVVVSVGGSFFDLDREPAFASLLKEIDLHQHVFPPRFIDPWLLPPLIYPPSLTSSSTLDYDILTEAIRLGRTYPRLSSAPAEIQALQDISVETWLEKTFPNATDASKDMVREFVLLQMSVDASLQHAYGFLQYVAEIVPFNEAKTWLNRHSFPVGPAGSLIYQVSSGTGRVSTLLEHQLRTMGVRIRMGTKVVAVDDTHATLVSLETATGNRYHAREAIILTAGPIQLRDLSFQPPLPPSVDSVLHFEKQHDTVDVQVFAFFKTPWWLFTVWPKAPVIVPPARLFREMRKSPPPADAPRLFGTSIAVPPLQSSNSRLAKYAVMRIMVPGGLYRSTPETLHDDVLSYLRYFNVSPPSPSDLVSVKVFDWRKELPTSTHGYFPVKTPLKGSAYFQENGGQLGRILFAGTQTPIGFVNTMEGATRSGYFAADRILTGKARISYLVGSDRADVVTE